MSPDQQLLVKATWNSVLPIADTAASLFYQRLFEIDPAARALFKAQSLAEQRRKLIQALSAVVSSLNHLDQIVPTIQALGRRHAGYGVTNNHYASVGAALLWTLEQGLAGAWTPEVEAAWSAAYSLLSGVMKEAASTAASAHGQ
jgi:hemoglobin-like flavoprotein